MNPFGCQADRDAARAQEKAREEEGRRAAAIAEARREASEGARLVAVWVNRFTREYSVLPFGELPPRFAELVEWEKPESVGSVADLLERRIA